MRKLCEFKNNCSGIFWTVFVGLSTMLIATLVWGVCALVNQDFFTAMIPIANPNGFTLQLGQDAIVNGGIVVLIIDIGIPIWIFVSAFKRESQEFNNPDGGF